MKLTKNCKLILAAMHDDPPADAWHSPGQLASLSGLSVDTTLSVCDTLCTLGCARWEGRTKALISPTELGMSYKSIERSETRNAWLDRLVGAVAGVIACEALPRIIAWLLRLFAR